MISVSGFQSEFIASQKPSNKLMIVLHGKGDSLKPFRQFDQELNIPEMNYLLLNAPQKFMGGFSWYKEPPFMRFEILEVRKQMLSLIQEVFRQGWRAENTFLFGFSQGCLISSDLALNSGYQWAGVIGISGYFHFYPRWKNQLSQNMLKTPWFLTHGHNDEILPLETTRFGVEKLRSAGFSVKWIELDKRHVFQEKEFQMIRTWVKERLRYLPGEFRQNSKVSNTNPVSPTSVAFVRNIEKSQPQVNRESQKPTGQ